MRILSIRVVIALLTLSCGAELHSQDIIYIYGQPTWDLKKGVAFPLVFFEVDETSDSLSRVWSNEGKYVMTESLKIFESEGLVIARMDAGELLVFPMEDVTSYRIVNLPKEPRVPKFYLYAPESGRLILFFYYFRNKQGRFSPHSSYFDLDSESIDTAAVFDLKDLRISGRSTSYGGSNSDVITVRFNDKGIIRTAHNEKEIDAPPVDLKSLNSLPKNSWNLIAHQSEFQVLAKAPTSHEEDSTSLLIHSQSNPDWALLKLPGSSTIPQLINGFMVGVVSNTDPRTNFATHVGYHPIKTDQVVIVIPESATFYTVILGKNPEVLWLNNEIVYYRVGPSLYKASIVNQEFVNRQLMLTDPMVEHIHWAFDSGRDRSTEAEQ